MDVLWGCTPDNGHGHWVPGTRGTERRGRQTGSRPGSQAAIVYVTDGIAIMAYAEREYVDFTLPDME